MTYRGLLKKFIIVFPLILWGGSSALSQSSSLVDAIRDSIQNPSCQRACWLGIEPGVTTEDEFIMMLETNGYPYKTDFWREPEDLSYLIVWSQSPQVPYEYLNLRFATSVTTMDDIVDAIWFHPENLSLDDALGLFPEPPDLVSILAAPYRLYADQGVMIDVASGAELDKNNVFSIGLIDEERVNFRLNNDEDIRPCTEPVSLCNTPLQAPSLNLIFSISNATPTFTWSSENGVESYLLTVNSPSTSSIQVRFATDICDSSECSATLSQSLAPSVYTVAVQGSNVTTTSEWSNVIMFMLLP